MNLLALLLLVVCIVGLIAAKKESAIVFFLVGCCYMTDSQGVSILGANFPIFRLLLLAGIFRVVSQGEGLAGGLNTMDKLLLAWGGWVIFASFFHEWLPGSGPKFAIGAVFNVLAFYFMLRSFCRTPEDVYHLFGMLCWILAPVAILMLVEQVAHRNYFSVFGGVDPVPDFRNGRYRAQGPFSHAILAGTVGAGCVPLVLATWSRQKVRAIIGLVSCLLMVVASASSGPIMSLMFAVGGVFLFRYQKLVRNLVRAAIPVYLLLMLLMERPPYYLISKIDLTGASTGWHRSFLIEQTIAHLDEWWLFGTDRTRHWMPSQGRISEFHTDITNQYIAYGVNAGLLSMLLVIAGIWLAFKVVGGAARDDGVDRNTKFLLWCLGASLFAYCASGVSVAFFGQALFFFWLPIACLATFMNRESTLEITDVEDILERQDMERLATSSPESSPCPGMHHN
jgi:hypothetical protein